MSDCDPTCCAEWRKQPTVNPLSGRTIQPGKGVFLKLQAQCEQVPIPKVAKVAKEAKEAKEAKVAKVAVAKVAPVIAVAKDTQWNRTGDIMRDCNPPNKRWTSANRAAGILKGYCEALATASSSSVSEEVKEESLGKKVALRKAECVGRYRWIVSKGCFESIDEKKEGEISKGEQIYNLFVKYIPQIASIRTEFIKRANGMYNSAVKEDLLSYFWEDFTDKLNSKFLIEVPLLPEAQYKLLLQQTEALVGVGKHAVKEKVVVQPPKKEVAKKEVINLGEPVEFGREFIERIVSKMKGAPKGCKNMAVINKSNELDMATCTLSGFLAGGQEGDVYTLCCRGGCDYVIKHYKSAYNTFSPEKEIKNMKLLSDMGTGVHVYDAWTCGTSTFVVSQKMQMTATKYIVNALRRNKKNLAAVQKDVKYLGEKTKELANAIHSKGIMHGDLHVDNVMLNVSPSDPSKITDIKLIDLSKMQTNKSAAQIMKNEGSDLTKEEETWDTWVQGEINESEMELLDDFITKYNYL